PPTFGVKLRAAAVALSQPAGWPRGLQGIGQMITGSIERSEGSRLFWRRKCAMPVDNDCESRSEFEFGNRLSHDRRMVYYRRQSERSKFRGNRFTRAGSVERDGWFGPAIIGVRMPCNGRGCNDDSRCSRPFPFGFVSSTLDF